MKTSKIIFITLLATIALYILAAMIDVRITGYKMGDPANNILKKNTQTIPAFKVLYIKNIRNVSIVQSDSFYIELLVMKDSAAPKPNYTVKGDTLWLNGFEKPVSPKVWISVHIANKLNIIQLENSDIRIPNYNSEILSLVLDKSKVFLSTVRGNNSAIGTMNIKAKNNSSITVNSVTVDSVGIVLQNSEANLSISAKVLSGTLSESSKLFTRHPEEISLKRDATSKITVSGN